MMQAAAKAKRSAPHRRGSRFDHGGIHCLDRDGRLFASVPFHVALRRHPSPLAYVLRRHLRAPCARSVCDPKVASRGTVGYADRSARCVSPPYALLPFLPPKRIAEGAKAISPDIWRETPQKTRRVSGVEFVEDCDSCRKRFGKPHKRGDLLGGFSTSSGVK